MVEVGGTYQDYLNKFNKEKLIELVNRYRSLLNIFEVEIDKEISRKKKEDIVSYLENHLEDYLQYFLKTIDLIDLHVLEEIIKHPKKCNDSFLVDNRVFINKLLEYNLVFQKENIEVSKDVNQLLRKLIRNKRVKLEINKQDRLYKMAEGLIVAYGVIDLETFKSSLNLDNICLNLLENYSKKEYVIEKTRVVSTKLSNKKRINRYLKDKNWKVFTDIDYYNLGNMSYHHNIKSYKKLIKILKNYYVFKSSDIMYIDRVVIIPYLYNSLNEEEKANLELEETILKLFEFKSLKLKEKMIEEIKKVRDDFPLWEYRGFSKKEVISSK